MRRSVQRERLCWGKPVILSLGEISKDRYVLALLWTGLCAVFIHILLVGGLYYGRWVALSQIVTSSAPIKPPNEYFIEINPAVKDEMPVTETPFFSSKNQRAAQATAVENEQDEAIPFQAEGNETAHKIVPYMESTPPLTMQNVAENEKTATDSEGIGKPVEKTGEKSYPVPRARPQVKTEVVDGPLKKSLTSTSRIGLQAVDARFTAYGGYLQRLLEAISTQWQMSCRESARILAERGRYVLVEFEINATGGVVSLNIPSSTTGDMGISLAKNAILSPSPFGEWTEDMRLMLGELQSIQIHFFY